MADAGGAAGAAGADVAGAAAAAGAGVDAAAAAAYQTFEHPLKNRKGVWLTVQELKHDSDKLDSKGKVLFTHCCIASGASTTRGKTSRTVHVPLRALGRHDESSKLEDRL